MEGKRKKIIKLFLLYSLHPLLVYPLLLHIVPLRPTLLLKLSLVILPFMTQQSARTSMAHISFSVRCSTSWRLVDIAFYRYWNWDRNPNLAGSQELDLHWDYVARRRSVDWPIHSDFQWVGGHWDPFSILFSSINRVLWAPDCTYLNGEFIVGTSTSLSFSLSYW